MCVYNVPFFTFAIILIEMSASTAILILHRYCMRWGMLPPTEKLREHAWKRLYIQVIFQFTLKYYGYIKEPILKSIIIKALNAFESQSFV